jgi:hypothetical protein
MITDRLRSYDAAKRNVMPGVEHRTKVSTTERRIRISRPDNGADHETLQVGTPASAFCLYP